MDPDHPDISEDRLSKFGWEEFYRGAEDPILAVLVDPRGNSMSVFVFIDAYHSGDKVSIRSQTGILIFCNRASVMWFSKKYNLVQTSTFGSDFTAMKIIVEITQALRYKLTIFGVPINGPPNVYCDNEAFYNNGTIPKSVLSK